MNPQQLKNIIEAALLTAGGPVPMVRLQALFAEEQEQPDVEQIKQLLDELCQDYASRGIELKQVSSGYRIQATQDMGQWLNRLSEDKPSRYSRALLETLALVAYRQPITRGGVEDIRGVSVSSGIIKTLLEREWIRVVGHRDVPGRPALYGTTKQFLDYFNLQSLGELPPLAEMRSIEDIQSEFDLKFNQQLSAEGDMEAAAEGTNEQAVIARSDQDDSDAEQAPEPVDAALIEADTAEPEAGAETTAVIVADDDSVATEAVATDLAARVELSDEVPESESLEEDADKTSFTATIAG